MNKIWSIVIHTGGLDDGGVLSSRLWDLGTTGIHETGDQLVAYFDESTSPQLIQDALGALAGEIQMRIPKPTVEQAFDREPLLVGRRFVIVPVDRIVLPIDAAMAFGSGLHETTQLCLEALEQCCVPGQTVFDVGCGSGILALAAHKLGAGLVVASDIDEDAVKVAKRHFAGPLFVGSADGFPTGVADIVISNITARVNDRIASDLKRIAKPGGRIIVSGFLSGHEPQYFHPDKTIHSGDWTCFICDPRMVGGSANSDAHDAAWWI